MPWSTDAAPRRVVRAVKVMKEFMAAGEGKAA